MTDLPVGHAVTADEYNNNGVLVSAPTNVTVSNKTTETIIATYTIPANSAEANDVFEFECSGTCDMTSTPTITFRLRIGGTSGTAVATISYTTAANTQRPWWIRGYLQCVSTGSGGTWHGFMTHGGRIAGGASPGISAVWDDCTVNPTAKDTTANQDMVVTVQWGTASASNTVHTNRAMIRKLLA